MSSQQIDQPIIEWAQQRGLCFYYVEHPPNQERLLAVHYGQLILYFSEGKLVRIWLDADADLLREVIGQLDDLAGLAGRIQIGGLPNGTTVRDGPESWLMIDPRQRRPA
jgi:hypothetical protein